MVALSSNFIPKKLTQKADVLSSIIHHCDAFICSKIHHIFLKQSKSLEEMVILYLLYLLLLHVKIKIFVHAIIFRGDSISTKLMVDGNIVIGKTRVLESILKLE